MTTQGQIVKSLVEMEADELLHRIGLERRGSSFRRWSSTLGTVAFGVALGAGVTWLYTTKKGAGVRRKIEHGAHQLSESAATLSERMTAEPRHDSHPSAQPKH